MVRKKLPPRHDNKRRFWQAHLNACAKSGLAQNEYCRQNKLRSNQFCYWKKKLSKQPAALVSFVPVPIHRPELADRSTGVDSGLTIYLNCGISLGINNNFNSAALSKVLAALRE